MIDSRPRELIVATLDGLALEYHEGATGGVHYVQLNARLKAAQVGEGEADCWRVQSQRRTRGP